VLWALGASFQSKRCASSAEWVKVSRVENVFATLATHNEASGAAAAAAAAAAVTSPVDNGAMMRA